MNSLLTNLAVNALKQKIVTELEGYNNLPLHLAYLYLDYKPKSCIYFLDWKLSLDKGNQENKIIVKSTNENSTSFTGFSELYRKLFFEYKNLPTIKTKLKAIYTEGFEDLHINTKFSLKLGASQKTNFVYSRNQNLLDSIKKLAIILNTRSDSISFALAIPLLYLFRGTICKVEYSSFMNPNLKESSLITYDSQNHTIKEKRGRTMAKVEAHHLAYSLYDGKGYDGLFNINNKVKIQSW